MGAAIAAPCSFHALSRRHAERAPRACLLSAGDSAPRAAAGALALELCDLHAVGVDERLIDDLRGVTVAYPQWTARSTPGVTWLQGTLSPIPGLSDTALVTTKFPHDLSVAVESWAWWDMGVWIGPLHTNYGRGSICTHEIRHGTWVRGRDRLWQLLDLISVWVVRQMHVRYLGFWPGRQVLHTPEERLRDHLPGDLCGCDRLGLTFDACCRTRDEAHARTFRTVRPFPSRRPAPDVLTLAYTAV